MSFAIPLPNAPSFADGREHRALLLHAEPEEVMGVLAACQGLNWAVATCHDEVMVMLESPLWEHSRIVVTPHCADQVLDFPRRFAERFAELWKEAR